MGYNMNEIVGEYNFLFLTFDTLRYDAAFECMEAGELPNLKRLFDSWEKRHSPGNFTYAAHHAFFAGFLPTPAKPGKHERLFALSFDGSETTTENTCVFEKENIIQGFKERGYHTICIGGVGFFNKRNAIGSTFPNMFDESYWDTNLGVTDKNSTANQFKLAEELIKDLSKKFFLFINLSALHQPNCFYLEGAEEDTYESHKAALRYVDTCLPALIAAVKKKGPAFCIFTSDHGTAYGEDNYIGHRLSHETTWNVPYKEFILNTEAL